METLLLYLLKSCGTLLMFFLTYQLLAKETFFKVNRMFLISGIVISFLFPLFTYTHVEPLYIPQTSLEQSVANTVQETVEDNSGWSVAHTIGMVYLIGFAFFLTLFLLKILSVRNILHTGFKRKLAHLHLIRSEHENTPFSFFNYLVYNPKNYQNQDFSAILHHEFAHIRQMHSVDILLTEIASIVLWFFPIVHVYKKQVSQNLEYLADTAAIEKTKNVKQYSYLLLHHQSSQNELPLVSSFFKLSIKKRIVMLQKSKSSKRNTLKLGIIIPLLLAFFFTFNYQSEAQIVVINNDQEKTVEHYEFPITQNTSNAEIEAFSKTIKEKLGIDFSVKGIKRNSSGSIVKFKSSYTSNGVSGDYKIANNNGIEPVHFFARQENGVVNCGYTTNRNDQDVIEDAAHLFVKSNKPTQKEIIEIVEKETATEERPEVIEVIEDTPEIEVKKNNNYVAIYTGEDAVKKIETNVKQVIITDSIQVLDNLIDPSTIKTITIETKDGKKETIEALNSGVVDANGNIYIKTNKNVTVKNSEKPLIVINGKKQPKDYDLESIKPTNIESINVLKGTSATDKYGDEAKYGVLEITLKK